MPAWSGISIVLAYRTYGGADSLVFTNVVHNGAMRPAKKNVRQSVSLSAGVAAQIRGLAKARRLSANRVIVEMIESGMEADKRKEQAFFDLAERFRAAVDPDEVKRLGDEMGRMVFSG